MHPLPIYKKWILYPVVLLVALGIATPALADYLGPNRTVVTQVGGTCKITLNECMYVPTKGYRYHTIEDWLCSNESKPWQEYPSSGPACNAANNGRQYWQREEPLEEVTITHPPATIDSSLQNCTLQNGWCGTTTPQLSLSANEPIAGQSIILIEGILNGQTFACPGGTATCSISLNEGDNNFTYWALSSWGDSSTMGTTSARVDTVSPDVGLDISSASGTNGWYISPTIVTATGSDSTSGLASALLSVDGEAWQSSATLNDGVHEVTVTASDIAGNVSNASATLSVDTTTPDINVSIDGTAGQNGWYRSNIQASALASDATSGITSLEVSVNGSAYEKYTSPISFSDGYHTIQFRAADHAGNITETPLQELYVDTVAPDVDLPASWELGRNIPYSVQDSGSGLLSLRLVIEDEDERHAKVAWNETVSGASYSQDIDWNGEFKDKTAAPPGTYLVWIKAGDMAGNERIQLGKVIVPEPNVVLSLLQPDHASAEMSAPPEDLFEDEDSSAMAVPAAAGTSAALSTTFGGSTTTTKEPTTQSFLLTTGTAGSIPATSSNVLWGAAAAAAIGAATAYALEERRKREETIARQAIEAAQEIEHNEKKRSEKLQRQQENWAQQQALEAAQIHPAYFPSIERKIGRQELEEGAVWRISQAASRERYEEKKRAEAEKIKNQELQDGLAAYYAAMRQGEKEAPKPEPNWWDKTKAFVGEKVVDPFIKPASQSWKEIEASVNSWVNKTIYYPYAQPAEQKFKQGIADTYASIEEKFYQPHVKPVVAKINERVTNSIVSVSEKFYQPHIKPLIEKEIQRFSNGIELLNEKVYQPYIQPIVALADEKLYQPYVQPIVERNKEFIASEFAWISDNIYQPFLEPVVSDIDQYIYQPLARKLSNAWDQYGEWVHGALDVVGFIPGFGEIADAINGSIYLAEGRRLEATLSLVSAVPVLGYFGNAGKLSLKAGQEIVDTVVEKVVKEFAGDAIQQAAKKSLEEISEKALKETTTLISDAWVQRAIDLVGCISGTGNSSTVINGLIHLGQGRFSDAAMSAISMVPIVGSVVTTGRKIVGDSLQRLILKEANEELTERVAKELFENGEELVKQLIKETGEESAEKTTKDVFKETIEKTANQAKKELKEDEFIEKITGEDADTLAKNNAEDLHIKKIINATPQGVDAQSVESLKKKYDNLIDKHGQLAIDAMSGLNPNDANKLLRKLDEDVLDYAMQDGPDAVAALGRWSEDDLQQHGVELALRAKKDATVLAAVKRLAESGPIDPKNLTTEQRALIKEIAANSTQYANGGQVVLGKWVDISSGFVEYAQDTGSVHYNPHPDMWNLLGNLGNENQAKVAWLINQEVVRTGITRNLPFEYTLSGIPIKDLIKESGGVDAVFTGATDRELMQTLGLDYLPIRMRELQELQKAGYVYTFDETTNSYVFSLP